MSHSTAAAATVIDPVCGMTVDPATAAGTSSYNGETYHFCSRGCQTKFDAGPERYGERGSCCATKHGCC